MWSQRIVSSVFFTEFRYANVTLSIDPLNMLYIDVRPDLFARWQFKLVTFPHYFIMRSFSLYGFIIKLMVQWRTKCMSTKQISTHVSCPSNKPRDMFSFSFYINMCTYQNSGHLGKVVLFMVDVNMLKITKKQTFQNINVLLSL